MCNVWQCLLGVIICYLLFLALIASGIAAALYASGNLLGVMRTLIKY